MNRPPIAVDEGLRACAAASLGPFAADKEFAIAAGSAEFMALIGDAVTDLFEEVGFLERQTKGPEEKPPARVN